MFARMIEWFGRRRARRAYLKSQATFGEVSDLAKYYEDQVNRLNVQIDVQHTELTALVMVRNTMAMRRDNYRETVAQMEIAMRPG